MKTLMTIVAVLFSVNAFAFVSGNPADFPNMDGLKVANKIQAQKAKLAVRAAQNTYPEAFGSDTTARFSYKTFNYKVSSAETGCKMRVKVKDNGKVVRKSKIRCN